MQFRKPLYIVTYCLSSDGLFGCKTLRHFKLNETDWNTGRSKYTCTVCGLEATYNGYTGKIEVIK